MAEHLVVIRSGVTEFEVQGRIRGILDIPLSPEGFAEADSIAAILASDPPVAVCMANAPCAVETARVIGRTIGIKPRLLPELTNLDLGLWQGMLIEEIRRKQPRLARQWDENPWSVVPPDGESLSEACDRVETSLQRMLRRHASGRVALVAPHPLDRVIRWIVAGELMGDVWERDPLEPSVVCLPVSSQWKAPARGRDRRLAASRP